MRCGTCATKTFVSGPPGHGLAGIGTDYSRKAKLYFLELAQFRNLTKSPPARLLVDQVPGSDDDVWNHCRVCGAGVEVSPVPWEGA